MGSDLKKWVSDNLISLLGYSQSTLVSYVIGLAKKSSSHNQLVSMLSEVGVSFTHNTQAFARDIFSRVEHKAAGLSVYRQKEREAAMLARKQKTYALLEDDDEDVDVNGTNGSNAILVSSQTRRDGKRFRKRAETDADEDKEEAEDERRVRRRTSSEEDDDGDSSESEEERTRDQRERKRSWRGI